MEVLYLCDRKMCGDKCSYPECKHTSDIEHAINFKKKHRYMVEEERNMCECKQILTANEKLERARAEVEALEKEVETNAVKEASYEMGYEVGIQMHAMLEGFKAAGFSERQAFVLLLTSLRGATK